jgi:hypothetical protein
MILPESLGNGQGPSTPQVDALRATVKASTVPDSRPFRVRLQVYQRIPSSAGRGGDGRIALARSCC